MRIVAALLGAAAAAAAGGRQLNEGDVGELNAAVQVVLVGSTSNLAKKYLWQSLFEMWDALHPAHLHTIAVFRDKVVVGRGRVADIVRANVSCGSTVTATTCDALKAAFLKNTACEAPHGAIGAGWGAGGGGGGLSCRLTQPLRPPAPAWSRRHFHWRCARRGIPRPGP
jgi:hypothetical protein